jgi:hypothetical protein
MKYVAEFVQAVALVQATHGDAAAARVFEKLFSSEEEATPAVLSRTDLHRQINEKVGRYVYFSDLHAANATAGKPWLRTTQTIPWIKAFREASGFGLKESKDTYDFLRDNPSLCE